MNIYSLALQLALVLVLAGAAEASAQPCVPPHITYSMLQDPVSKRIEVYLTSDKNYVPAIIGQSALVGITFPTGYAWPGGGAGVANFLNLQTNFNGGANGEWKLFGLNIAPSCGATKDYLVFHPNNVFSTTLTANQPRLLFSFAIPQVPAPCIGSVFLLDNSDPVVTSNGCTGTLTIANYINIIPGEGFVCDNYGGNTNNPGFNCDLSAPLPVELVTFSARAKGISSFLSWTTASERNSAGFEVERSLDGTDWEKIGFVKAQGNSTAQANYELLDNSPAKGANYYRLKIVDLDGVFEYSNIQLVGFGSSQGRAAVYPNPSNGLLTLELPISSVGDIDLKVVDTKGQVMFHQTLKESEVFKHALDLTFLPAAPYTVQATYAGQVEHFPFVLVK